MKRLLLIADTSVPEALGSKLLRGAESVVIQRNWKISVTYHSPAPNYSPSMHRKRGKVFYRLADKRSWEWWSYQRLLVKQIEELKPDLTLVTGVMPLDQKVFLTIKKQGGSIVNYLTDDPWNRIHKRTCFIQNLAHYDHIFSTKKTLQERLLQAGAHSTSWLSFAYDPQLHYPVESASGVDVVFVGTGARERLPWLESIGDLPGIKRRIHGNSWERINTPGWEKLPAVTGTDYCHAIKGAKVVLGLLRQANGDKSTDRSYEIGAIGGCGLYQDTDEHRQLLCGYPDEGFFRNPTELASRVKNLLRDTEMQERLRSIGITAIQRPENTYADRLQSILNWTKP